ncbi:carbohydrate ABC transporter permease [Bacillota bacterium Meth-B3]
MQKNQGGKALAFMAPYLCVFFFFRLLPSLASIYISMTKWSIVGSPVFVGFKNYLALFKDANFFRALANNAYFLLIVLPVLVALSLLVAIALNEKIPGRNAVRTIAVIPYVLIPAVVGIMWNWMYDKNFGIINYALSALGFAKAGFLIDRNIALASVSAVIVWSYLGYNMILYLAGLQGIPGEIYEAAQIDGAGRFKTFTRITLPLLSRTTSLIITLTLINVVQVYDQVVVMTGGGPSMSTMTLIQYQFITGFERQQLGYGSAVGVMILVLLIGLVRLQGLLFKPGEEVGPG